MGHAKPLLIFDGECGFCRAWVERGRRATGDAVDYVPYQEAAERFPEMERSTFAEAVHLVEPDGRVSRGAQAVFRVLAHVPGRGAGWWAYRRVPGFAPASEWLYRLVARHRSLLARLTR